MVKKVDKKISSLIMSSKGSEKMIVRTGINCAFCGKDQFDVDMVIEKEHANVCEECVDFCAEIMEEEKENKTKKKFFFQKQETCFYCKKSENKVKAMVKGPYHCICNECIEKAKKVF